MSFTLLLAACTVAAALCALLTPLSLPLARWLGAVDIPDRRKRHARPTPRLGGVAVYAASSVALLLFFPASVPASVAVAGGGLITALGVSDDVFDLPPFIKLAAEGAAALFPLFFGLTPRFLALSGGRGVALPPFIAVPLCLLWVLLLTNAINLVDGMDGLAATQAGVSAFALAAAGVAPVAMTLSGAAFGFLPYNKSRAQVFMGDSGALFFGYALAIFSLGEEQVISPLLPFFFAVPLFDLFTVFFRRLFSHENPFRADEGHLHHRLERMGYGRQGVVLFLFFLSALTAAGAVAFLLWDIALLLAFPALLLLFFLPLGFGVIRPLPAEKFV